MEQTIQIFNFSNCAELWLIITIWHIFSGEASCCHKMEFFKNSIRNAPYSSPNFIKWFIVKDFDIEIWNIAAHIYRFVFFIKTKKMIFLEVAVTIIGENTSTKCLQCINMIIHKESHSWKNVALHLFSPKIGPFVKVFRRSSH